jgi:hypothetical protein
MYCHISKSSMGFLAKETHYCLYFTILEAEHNETFLKNQLEIKVYIVNTICIKIIHFPQTIALCRNCLPFN